MRYVILGGWVLIALAAMGVLSEPMAYWLKWLGLALLVAHLAEYFLFKAKVLRQGDSTLMGFLNTMLYGYFYWGRKSQQRQ